MSSCLAKFKTAVSVSVLFQLGEAFSNMQVGMLPVLPVAILSPHLMHIQVLVGGRLWLATMSERMLCAILRSSEGIERIFLAIFPSMYCAGPRL